MVKEIPLLRLLRIEVRRAVESQGLRHFAGKAGVEPATVLRFVKRERGLSIEAAHRLVDAIGFGIIFAPKSELEKFREIRKRQGKSVSKPVKAPTQENTDGKRR